MQDMTIDLRLVGIIGGLDAVLENGTARTCERVCYYSGRDEMVWIKYYGMAGRVINEALAIAVEGTYEVNVGVFGDRRFEP